MKKKLIIFITFLLLSNFCFAGIVVQSGLSPLGYDIRYEEDCFNVTNPKDFSTEFFAAIHSLNSSLMWEFNSNDIEKPFHFMTGAEFSFSTPGLITITIPTIFEFTLLNFNKTMIELQLNPNLGIGFGIKGGVYFFYNPSIDVTFGRKDRKWLYGGAGLKFGGIFESAHFKGYGKNIYSETVIGLNLFVGVRFPTW